MRAASLIFTAAAPVALGACGEVLGIDAIEATSGVGASATSGASSTSTSATSSSESGGARCGDGIRDSDEACDGGDLGGITCLDFGANLGGVPRCEACELDAYSCVAAEPCAVVGGQPGSPWPMFRRCASRTGQSPNFGPGGPARLWSRTLANEALAGEVPIGIVSSPVVAADGTIIVGAGDGVHATRPDGSSSWHYATTSRVEATPAIGVDGTTYVPEVSGTMHAIWPDGSKRWARTFDGSARASPATLPDGGVVFTVGTTLHWLTASGETLASSEGSGEQPVGSPAVDLDGAIVVGSADGSLLRFERGTSSSLIVVGDVTLTPGMPIDSAPALAANGTTFVAGRDGSASELRSEVLAPPASTIWLRASPAVDELGGGIFAGETLFRASGGEITWEVDPVSFVWGSPAVDAAGLVFVTTGFVALAYDPRRTEEAPLWQSSPMGHTTSSPALGHGGRLYVTSVVGNSTVLFAYGPS